MRVKFVCQSGDDFEVRLVGDHEELGEWSPDRAIPMVLAEEGPGGRHRWEHYVELPAGTGVEFKYVKLVRNGFRWERDPNRVFRFEEGVGVCEGEFREPA
jgi:hypothetical protein